LARKLRLLRRRAPRTRQAAIDTVGGKVVGGMPTDGNGDGIYLVFIQDDGSGTALHHAAIRLNKMAQVDYADLDYRIVKPDTR
jgi:hypothetical protein